MSRLCDMPSCLTSGTLSNNSESPMSRPDAPPAPRDRPATERAIVEAAAGLLATRGFSALNVQAVAEAAGVDRKLVYRYFGGVEGVVERLGSEIRWTLGKADRPASGDSYGAAIGHLARAYADALAGDATLRGLIAWELVESTPLLQALEAARSAAMQTWMAGRIAGLHRPDGVDAPAVNAILIAGVQLLALRRGQGRPFAGVTLNDAGWARIEAAVETLAEGAYADRA